jgi:hypothetical protein
VTRLTAAFAATYFLQAVVRIASGQDAASAFTDPLAIAFIAGPVGVLLVYWRANYRNRREK